jgi:RNase P subunit RPR2
MSKEDKLEAMKRIEGFFKKPTGTNSARKIKNLAMKHNIKLGNLRKKFCKKCYSVFNSENSKIRISKGFKIVKCKCGFENRWKMN